MEANFVGWLLFVRNLGSRFSGVPEGIWLGFRGMGIEDGTYEIKLIAKVLEFGSEIPVTRLE